MTLTTPAVQTVGVLLCCASARGYPLYGSDAERTQRSANFKQHVDRDVSLVMPTAGPIASHPMARSLLLNVPKEFLGHEKRA